MGDDAKLTFGGDSKDVVRELKKTQREVDRLKDKLARTGQTSKKAGDQGKTMNKDMGGVARTAGKLLGVLGMAGGIGGAMSLIVQYTEKYKQKMHEVYLVTRKAGLEMTTFALMQGGGKKAERVRETAALGAGYGVDMGEAWDTVQALQSQSGGYEKGKKAAIDAWKLMQTGVNQKSAAEAVSIGMGLGMDSGTAARSFYAAGKESSKTAEEIAQSAKGLPKYMGIEGGPQFGLAVAAQLSQIYKDPGSMGTFTKKFGGALLDEKLWGNLGYKGKVGQDPFAQLDLLKTLGKDKSLTALGFTEEREKDALSLILRNVPELQARYKEIKTKGATPGYLGRIRSEAEAEMPEMKLDRIMSKAEQMQEGYKAFGPQATTASNTELLHKVRTMALQLQGKLSFIEDDPYSWNEFIDQTAAQGSVRSIFGEKNPSGPGREKRYDPIFQDFKKRMKTEGHEIEYENTNAFGGGSIVLDTQAKLILAIESLTKAMEEGITNKNSTNPNRFDT